jgi:hypothetical protein
MNDNRPKTPQYREVMRDLSEEEHERIIAELPVLEGALADEVSAKLHEIEEWFTSRGLHHAVAVLGTSSDNKEPRMQAGAFYINETGLRLAACILSTVCRPRAPHDEDARVALGLAQRDTLSVQRGAMLNILEALRENPEFDKQYQEMHEQAQQTMKTLGGIIGGLFGAPPPPPEETPDGNDDRHDG